MTTIAYKDGILVGDTLLTMEDGNTTYRVERVDKVSKIVSDEYHASLGDKIIYYAERGDHQAEHTFDTALQGYFWKKEPYKDPVPEDETSIIAVYGGEVYDIYCSVDKCRSKFTAKGSGKQFALGAMEAGASAIEAVAVAIKYDVHSDWPIQGYNTKTGEYFRFENAEELERSRIKSISEESVRAPEPPVEVPGS